MNDNNTSPWGTKAPANQLQPPKDNIYFAVNKKDWKRLKTKVDKIEFSYDLWSIFASIFGGSALSTILTIFSCFSSNDSTVFIKILTVSIFVGSLVGALVCLRGCKTFENKSKSDLELIKEYVKEIDEDENKNSD